MVLPECFYVSCVKVNAEEKWHNAVRPVATLFVNLGLADSMLAFAATDESVLHEVSPPFGNPRKKLETHGNIWKCIELRMSSS
jgi:hypothetical protein